MLHTFISKPINYPCAALWFFRDASAKKKTVKTQNKLINKINYSPPSHKMQPTTWDPRTTNTNLCGTTFRKPVVTKIITPLVDYPRRHLLTHPQTNESGRKDLVPTTPWTGPALGLPSATTFFNTHSHPTTRKVHKTWLNSFPEWKNKLLPPQSLHTPCLWPHSHPKNLDMRSKNCSQTNHQAPLALPTELEYYKLVTLIFKDSSSFSSTVPAYGNFKHIPQTGTSLFYNPYTQDTTRTKQTQHPTEAYISTTPSESLKSAKAFSFLDWQHRRYSSAHTRTQHTQHAYI